MSRRTGASLLALVLLIGAVVLAARSPVPYVTVSPGPTVNVLGELDGKRIVEVKGHKTYPTDGELRLTTVSITNPERSIDLLTAIGAWLRPDIAVLPFEAMYPTPSTDEEERAESAAQMVNSQDNAVAAALTQLGYQLSTYAEVTGVTPGGPSEDLLKPRDRLVAVDGTPTPDVDAVLKTLAKVKPGEKVTVEVRRGGADKSIQVRTGAATDDPKRAVLGVLVGTGYAFPFDVRVALGDNIGGPSAGLIFALSIYDTLTPGALTGGREIAGTGTIGADGTVGPIGGIRQKIVAADRAGAELFLVPPANCESALAAPVDDADIRLVRADTLASAIDSMKTYAQNPDADLPRCTS